MSIIDDERSVITLFKYNLEAAGYEVVVAFDDDKTSGKVGSEQPDLIILDAMLPKKDGIDVCKAVRTNKNLVPISMLMAKSDEFDRVLGLELGADDYMTEPFSSREIVARVKAVLRHSQFVKGVEEINDDTTIGSIRIRPNYLEVHKCNGLLELTPKEFELLLYLIERQGRATTREHMLDTVWNYEFVEDSRIVGVHISHLRDKLEDNPRRPQLIKAVRGLGYKLERPKRQ